MQSNRDNQQHHGSFPNLQYYEITRQSSDASITDSLQPSSHTSSSDTANAHPRQPGHGSTAHLHPINMCAGASLVSQGIIPGSVFGDGSHLHYHIYPSRRVMNCPEPTSDQQGCRSHSRMEQIHHHEQQQHHQQQHHQQQQHQHYPRQPRTTMMRPPTRLDELAKERGRQTPQSNFDNLSRYPLGHKMHDMAEKTKNISLMELSSDSQATITSTKGKCQCHTLHQQPLRLKRDGGDGDDGIADANREDRQPPALPPRPPPRPSSRRYELPAVSTEQRHVGSGGGVGSSGGGGCCKKYVVLCWLCGGLSAAVGSLFLAVHAVLSAHTASLALFETVPSYIPGTMLIFMGLFTMLLARRKHRYGFLMKVCGSVSVVCALVCVLVTVTTTVVHMSRLQGLRECVYTARAKSCTCYGAPQSRASDPGVLFEGTPHCEAVHGALYACLRALFGVSVAGILACIFSCMLVYQLLSHEKKKMYWEQLELRCRSLYGPGAGPAFDERVAGSCGCCNDCGGIGPWWAQSPGNLYTPNPDLAPSRRWRLPWSRSRGPAPSTDSNYGFAASGAGVSGGNGSGAGGMVGNQVMGPHHQSDHHGGLMDHGGLLQPYSILGPQSAGAYSVLQAGHPHPHDDPYAQNNGASPYSVLEAAVPLWGPPPPYSDPNSPARRPMLAYPTNDPRSRLSKRIDNFPLRDVEYNRSPDIKRPSGNYENAEQVSNDTDTDTVGNSEARVTRGSSKHKKLLKGVENAAFQQQESSSIPKQSESELYFGDVSSCCGPESSLYDVATEKDGKSEGCQSEAGTSSYLPSSQFTKRPSSKRSRRQQQQQQQISPVHLHRDNELLPDQPSHSSCSSAGDEPAAAAASSSSTYSMNTTAEVEYEVIRQQQQQLQQQQQQQQQQRRYGYDPSRPENISVVPVYSEKQQKQQAEAETAAENRASESDDGAYGADEEVEERDEEERDFKDYRSSSYEEDIRPVNV